MLQYRQERMRIIGGPIVRRTRDDGSFIVAYSAQFSRTRTLARSTVATPTET
jgi:hypothetical protein